MSHFSSLWVVSFPAELASPVKQGARTPKRSRAEVKIVMISFFCCNLKTKKTYILLNKTNTELMFFSGRFSINVIMSSSIATKA
jgi:hypothetical protein